MKERPILFSAPMVLAILDGRKTQTRRVIDPQADDRGYRCVMGEWENYHGTKVRRGFGDVDRLWVRECWFGEIGDVAYRADGDSPDYWVNSECTECKTGKWRPSIHMPRWASRITLEVTDIRFERLQDITEGDAIAEGVTETRDLAGVSSVGLYHALWDSINAKRGYGWEANPWVWAITFKRIKP